MEAAAREAPPAPAPRAARSLHDRVLGAAPAERLAALRVLIGAYSLVYLIARVGSIVSSSRFVDKQWKPVGLLASLGAPPHRALVYGLLAVGIASGALFVAGKLYRFAAPAFAASLLVLLTYRNSWGMVFHTENLTVVHVATLALAPAADAWSLDANRSNANRSDARARPSSNVGGVHMRYGWPILLLSTLTAATYLLAGIAKLRLSGLGWVTSDILRNEVAYDNARKMLLGDVYAPLAQTFVHHPKLFRPLAGVSLVVELAAPIALFHRRIAAAWCAAAWGFHVGVVLLMAIFFPYPVLGLAFASFFELERPARAIARRAAPLLAKIRRAPSSSDGGGAPLGRGAPSPPLSKTSDRR